MRDARQWAWVLGGAAALCVGALGCDGDKSAASFSAFERCLLGAPPKDDAELAQRLRVLELALLKAPTATAATDWPKRCEVHANALYQSLGSSSETSMLRKELASQLGCKEDPNSCKFPAEGSVLSSPAGLWQAAKVLGLERQDVPGVEAPAFTARSLIPGAGWPALAEKGWSLADTHQTADGKVWLLLRAPSGRVPVRFCELVGSSDPKASFAEVTCRAPHTSVPSLPLQSVMLVDYDALPAVAGLSPEGRVGYALDTGKELPVRGYPGSEVTEGVAVERGANDEGYEAYVLSGGKRGDAIELKIEAPVVAPKTVGQFVVWSEKGADGKEALVVQESAGPKKLKEAARLAGNWGVGELHTCRTPGGWVVASWGLARGNRGARATAGSDGTEVTVAFFDAAKKSWSVPVTGKLPFDRVSESPASCSDGRLSIAWGKETSGNPMAGVLICTAAGCKASESSWTSLGVQGWAGVAPLAANRVLVAYRTTLGDLRARIGEAGAMDKATEFVLTDDEAHGGPVIGSPTVLASPGAVLLLFKGESGMSALRIGADGEAKPLPVK